MRFIPALVVQPDHIQEAAGIWADAVGAPVTGVSAAGHSPSRSTTPGSPRCAPTWRATVWTRVCVTGPEDVYYLTGLDHQGHFAFTALVLPATGEPMIVAREMEHTTLSVQVPWCRHVAVPGPRASGRRAADRPG